MNLELSNYIKDCSTILKGISNYVYQYLTHINITCTLPQGAFYMLIDFEFYRKKLQMLKIGNVENLCTYLLENYNVALLPGQDFYLKKNSLTCRLAFVDFNGEKVYKLYKKHTTIDLKFY